MKKYCILLVLILLLSGCSTPKKEEVVRSDITSIYYEIFTSSFYDSNGNGVGDFNGISESVDYLRNTLNVHSVWLTPIHKSPSYHKYDVVDYYSVDPSFGTLDDFKNMVNILHENDIEVIIDLVINHTSSQNEWFIKARQSINNGTCDEEGSYCDYYVYSDKQLPGYYPMGSGLYYEALFYDGMPDLNLDNEDVREEIRNIMKFWLDNGVDGFRLDAVSYYYNQDVSKNIEFLSWLNDEAKKINPECYIVAEAWNDANTISRLYESGIDSLFNFPLSSATGLYVKYIRDENGVALANNIVNYQNTVKEYNANGIDSTFISNHDQGRSSAYFATQPERQRLLVSVYLLAPGNVFMYYGEEIGLKGSGVDPNKRLPMIWDINDKAHQAYPPTGADYSTKMDSGVVQQLEDKDSLLNHYIEVLNIRNKYDAIARGNVSNFEVNDKSIMALAFEYQDDKILVLHNFSAETKVVEVVGYKMEESIGVANFKDSNVEMTGYSTVILIRGE